MRTGALAALLVGPAFVLAHPGATELARQPAAGIAHPGSAGTSPTIYVGDGAPPYAVTVIDARTRAVRSVSLGGYQPVAFASSPNGSTEYVAAVGSDTAELPGRLVSIRSSSGTAGWSTAIGSEPELVAVSPSGRMGYVLDGVDAAVDPVGTPGTITPVDLATGVAAKPIKVGVNPGSIAISPDGGRAYVTDSNASNGDPTVITPVDLATGTAGAVIHVPALSVVVTPNSAWAYAITAQGLVRIDAATGVPGKTIGLGPIVPVDLLLAPDGSTLYVLGTPDSGLAPTSSDLTLVAVSTANDTVSKSIALPGLAVGRVNFLAATPNGSEVFVLSPGKQASATSPGLLAEVSAARGKLVRTIKVGFNSGALAVDPDGATVYVLSPGSSGGAPGSVRTDGSVIPVSVQSGALGAPIKTGLGGDVMSIAP